MTTTNPTWDAIVIGSGVTGGWAAKELSEKGLRVLMLDRGRMVEHGKDYSGEHRPPWDIPFRGKPLRDLYAEQYPVQSTLWDFDETTRPFFNNDRDNPYASDPDEFRWYRADVVGGRSLLWGRQTYRWSDLDFEANAKDGHGIDWPIRYADIAPWYSYVERFVGISGQAEQLPQLPDSEFLPPMAMTAAEEAVKAGIEAHYPDRRMTIGRCAVLTQPHNGRGACHYCGPCPRGCSVGAYFSTQSSTLPAARATGNLTLEADAVVAGIDFDPASRRATGVRVISSRTKAATTHTARMVFLCASTVGSLQVLLNSRSEAFPTGLANSSGVLGTYLMDHHFGSGAYGTVPGVGDRTTYGWRPNGIYIPRFRNLGSDDDEPGFLRGYGYQGGASRAGWQAMANQTPGFGARFKAALRRPGPWSMTLGGFGECLPYAGNRVALDEAKPDRFGIPQVSFEFSFGENEARMREDMKAQAVAMLEAAGALDVRPLEFPSIGGQAIHEMGGARMGHDPTESVLNRWNQAHDVPNLFVTDGACMTSSSCVNPSLTYMAITARAADFAATQLAAGAL